MEKLVVYSPMVSHADVDIKFDPGEATLAGRRVGFLWGLHDLSTKFWPVMEETAQGALNPGDLYRYYKTTGSDGVFRGNTWIAIPDDEVEQITEKIDYAVCGVGA